MITISQGMKNDIQARQKKTMLAVPEGAGSCANCNGGGVLVATLILEGPLDYVPSTSLGEAATIIEDKWYKVKNVSYPCPVCRPTAPAITRVGTYMANSGLEPAEQDWSIAFYDGMAGKENAQHAAAKILSQSPTPRGLYVFFGDYGVGKSGLLKSIVSALVKAGVRAKYVRANDILGEIRSAYDTGIPEDAITEKIMHYQFLAVDEVDRISDTEWARATLFGILDKRYNARHLMCTAMATNQWPDRMGDSWKYLMNRMLDGVRVPVGGICLRGT